MCNDNKTAFNFVNRNFSMGTRAMIAGIKFIIRLNCLKKSIVTLDYIFINQ